MLLRLILCKIRVCFKKTKTFPLSIHFHGIGILNEDDTLFRSLSQSIQIPLYLFTHTSSPIQIPCKSNTNLYFFIFYFFCSDECQMPEHFWMVKLLGPINSLKLNSFAVQRQLQTLCYLHNRFSAEQIICYNVMI